MARVIENTVRFERPPRLDNVCCFDRIARLYRPLEYLSFGPMLERCRFHHLAAIRNCRRALVIGAGLMAAPRLQELKHEPIQRSKRRFLLHSCRLQGVG